MRELEDEVVHAFATVARSTTSSATVTGWGARYFVASYELAITGEDTSLTAALIVSKHRLRHVLAGNADLVTTVRVGNAAPIDRICDSLFDVLTIAVKKTLAIDGAFMAAVGSTIDY